MSGYDVSLADCPARTTLELVSGTWTVVVLVGLAHQTRRYTELLAAAGGISRKMLTKTLKELVLNGLVRPPTRRGEGYALTELGASLMVPLTAMTAWAEQNTDALLAAQDRNRA